MLAMTVSAILRRMWMQILLKSEFRLIQLTCGNILHCGSYVEMHDKMLRKKSLQQRARYDPLKPWDLWKCEYDNVYFHFIGMFPLYRKYSYIQKTIIYTNKYGIDNFFRCSAGKKCALAPNCFFIFLFQRMPKTNFLFLWNLGTIFFLTKKIAPPRTIIGAPLN